MAAKAACLGLQVYVEAPDLAAGLDAARCSLVPDEEAAALELLAWAQPGDVIVLPVHTAAVRARLTGHLGALN